MKALRPLAGVVLILGGAVALATSLAGYAEGIAWQRSQGREATRSPAILASKRLPGPGAPYARLRIPKIGLDLTVIEGTRKRDLIKGPGHLSGSGAPGEYDNCVIAGHRDLHFRELGRLSRGDVVELEAGGRVASYRVEAAEVIDPAETEILAPSREPLLTLVTCYPFRYLGPAPRRYVVRARMETSSHTTL